MLIRSFVAAFAARIAFAALATFVCSAAAQAQFNTFVSSTGSDTRPCTVQAQPCRTLQRAVAVTATGGTIRFLSDLGGQPGLTIAKSLTVEGSGYSMIGTIVIDGASAIVTLNGLHLTGRNAVASGVSINSAAAVYIADCTVERYTNDGIKLVATTATKLFVSDTVSRANGSDGLYVDAVNALADIQNSRFEANASSGVFLKTRRASVSGSVASANGANGIIQSAGSANFTETTAANNVNNGFQINAGGGILSSSVAHGNFAWGLYIALGATGIITDSVIAQNGTGIYNDGTLNTFRDNQLIRNNSFAYQGSGQKQDESAF